MDTEQQLLQRVQAMDRDALALVFDRYYEPIYRYIYQHIGHRSTAENLAAEVFKQLLEALTKGTGPREHLKAWLYRVAHNLYVNELRRQNNRADVTLESETLADNPDLVSAVQQAYLSDHIRAALLALTPKQRAVIVLKFVEGLTNEEAAEILDISYGAVKSLQNRGLASIRRYLVRRGVVEEVQGLL